MMTTSDTQTGTVLSEAEAETILRASGDWNLPDEVFTAVESIIDSRLPKARAAALLDAEAVAIPVSVTALVLTEVGGERAAQDAKWGEQNHPDLDQVLLNRPGGCTPQRMAEEYEIPTASRARFLCDTKHQRGQGTWADILVEEVAEAIGTNGDTGALRTELIQVAAVAVAWVEAIDRRGAPQ